MPHFIGSACLDVTDRSCVEECPVDCIYEGDRKLYIHPGECIDCGACLPACPMSAISTDVKARESEEATAWLVDNSAFFAEALPGRGAPLDSPAGATAVGRVGVDTVRAAAADHAEA